MKRAIQFLAVGCLTAAALLSPGKANAQFRYNPYQAYLNRSYWQNSASVQQMFNSNVQAVYSTQAFGSPVNPVTFPNFYPNYYTTPYYLPAAPYYPPTYSSPYVPAMPGSGVSPYASADPSAAAYSSYSPYSPYNPYNPYNPYYNSGYGPGAVLTGSADLIRSYGTYLNSLESARSLREQALQAKKGKEGGGGKRRRQGARASHTTT